MMRLLRIAAWLLVPLAAAVLPALAQETRFELAAGGQYPLLSQKFYADQDLGFHVRFGVRLSPKVTVAATYEHQSTKSAVPNWSQGDVKLKHYGLNGIFVLNGDADFQLIGLLGAGMGDVTFSNPRSPDQYLGLPDDSKIKLWYEAGVGVLFNWGKHWAGRIQVTGRQTEPKEANAIFSGTRFSFVPSLDIVLKF